ncbi:Olfactory receptor 1052 [Camelus dromedarius]|uniref:Olfactory receptor n=2 Tax=Camelus dromedarius TaxID=9838 RepID=A0A5N4DN09_CAMDR|nr:olfactory receptor 476-like [Camelus dromedarius]KAB1272304.1 Olfactory receptor 1052 [Camelus dromedarius]
MWDLGSRLPLRDGCDFSVAVAVKGYLSDENVNFLVSPPVPHCLENSSRMALGQNHTTVTKFILLGLTDQADQKQLLFAVFLLIYAVTMVGNLGLIDVIRASSTLHTPMYFLLSALSFLDICNSSVFTPRLLVSFLSADQSISFVGCVVQMALMALHGTGECLLLAIMAYDRFVAVCHPLLYHTIMSKRLCVRLVVVTYAVGVFISTLQTGNAFILPYCGPNIIDHYFCDIPPVLQLACSDTTVANVILLFFSALITVPTISVILVSYAYILVTICRMRSLEAQRKAFSTCASHLTALSLFYGSVFLVYVQPNPETASAYNKILSVFYTIVIPMLNPLVYSLRNKDVKAAVQVRALNLSRKGIC